MPSFEYCQRILREQSPHSSRRELDSAVERSYQRVAKEDDLFDLLENNDNIFILLEYLRENVLMIEIIYGNRCWS